VRGAVRVSFQVQEQRAEEWRAQVAAYARLRERRRTMSTRVGEFFSFSSSFLPNSRARVGRGDRMTSPPLRERE
jgi:hypothetical protein